MLRSELINLLHAQLLQKCLLFILGPVKQLKQAPASVAIELNNNLEVIKRLLISELLLIYLLLVAAGPLGSLLSVTFLKPAASIIVS